MREALEVNKEAMIPLRSSPGLDSIALRLVIGLWPMYLLGL